jgi:hypothetical protein
MPSGLAHAVRDDSTRRIPSRSIDLADGDGSMKGSVFLAAVAAVWLLVVFPGAASAQNGQGNGAGQPDAEGTYTYVLKLNEESLQMLRAGQSLKSVIPPELRNRVTEIRIEFEQTSPASSAGVSTGTRFGPEIPDLFANSRLGNSSTGSNGLGNTGLGNSGFGTAGNGLNAPPLSASNPANGGSGSIPPLRQQQPAWSDRATAGLGDTMAPVVPRGTGSSAGTNPGAQPGNDNRFPPAGNNSSTPSNGAGSWPNTSGGTYVPPTQSAPQQNAPQGDEVDTVQQTAPAANGGRSMLPPLGPTGASDWNAGAWPPDGSTAGTSSLISGYPADSAYGQRFDSRLPGYHLPETPAVLPAVPNMRGNMAENDPLDSQLGQSQTSALPAAEVPGGNEGPAFATRREGANPVSNSSISRYTQFLYFWLLCSIGLNIYLGWIARGFYVRYRELADELRESFATV